MTNFSPEQFSDWLAKAVKKFPPNSKAGIISGEVAELSYEQGGKDKLGECCEWLRTKELPDLADQLLHDLAPEPVDGEEEGVVGCRSGRTPTPMPINLNDFIRCEVEIKKSDGKPVFGYISKREKDHEFMFSFTPDDEGSHLNYNVHGECVVNKSKESIISIRKLPNLTGFAHCQVKITTVSGMTLTGKLTPRAGHGTYVFTTDHDAYQFNYDTQGIIIGNIDSHHNIKEIVEVSKPTPLQLKVKRCHEYVLTVDEQFHTSLVELAKKLNKTEAQLIQDALNFYSNAAEEWEKNNR